MKVNTKKIVEAHGQGQEKEQNDEAFFFFLVGNC